MSEPDAKHGNSLLARLLIAAWGIAASAIITGTLWVLTQVWTGQTTTNQLMHTHQTNHEIHFPHSEVVRLELRLGTMIERMEQRILNTMDQSK